MTICLICDHHILRQARTKKCNLCYHILHYTCIPFYQRDIDDFSCEKCLHSLFPFNSIGDETEFLSSISGNPYYNLIQLNNMVFSTLTADEYESPDFFLLSDSDPDIQFYNELPVMRNVQNCQYYNEDSLHEKCTSSKVYSSCFSILHFNIRSFPCHSSEFECYIKELFLSFTVIGLCETWFDENNYMCHKMEGYSMECINRKDRRGGGVAILILEHIDYSKRNDLCRSNESIECVFIEISRGTIKSNKNIIIGEIYRPPNTDIGVFNSCLIEILDIIQRENKLVYLLGDYNINLLNTDTHSYSSEFVDTLYSYSFFPLINRPTRTTDQTSTLIDNIFTNDILHNNLLNGILLTDISDHFPVFTVNTGNIIYDKDLYRTFRDYSQNNINTFNNELRSFNWNILYSINESCEAFDYFYDQLCKLYDKCFPRKCVKIGYRNRKTWLTPGLKISIKHKNKLFIKSKNNSTESNCNRYKIYKKILAKIMRIQEKSYYGELFQKHKSNVKKSWQIIKSVINKTSNHGKLPSEFNIDNNMITCPKRIANSFNQYYVNIGKNLAQNIPQTPSNPIDYVKGTPNSIFISDTNSDEIASIICNLKNSSPGHDDIDAKILKHSYEHIIDPLIYVFNKSLNQGKFPNQLKLARVTPIYKSGDPTLMSNYRPVSVLPVLSKILEKIMLKRLNSFFEAQNLFYKLQFGFRSKHSTSLALIYLIDTILNSINNGDTVLGLLIDYRKAFDTVNHNILLDKMAQYGVRGIANQWIKHYLSHRQQFVAYNNHNSSYLPITCGVPQGSILGPFLFLCYINDLPNVSNLITPLIFADDTNLFITGKDPNTLITILNEELIKITEWTNANKLSLNTEKTKYIVFSKPKSRIIINTQLVFNNEIISSLQHVKFLGVYLDNKMTWNIHINHICKKISKGIGIICKARKSLDEKTLITLYHSFVYPYVSYGIEIWGKAINNYLSSIFRLQKKVLRIIAHVKMRTESAPLFHKFRILSVYQVHQLQILIFMYKYVNGLIPVVFDDFFERLNEIRSTRNDGLFRIPLVRTVILQRALRYQGVFIWNYYYNRINHYVGYITYKKHVKRYLLNSINS